MDFLLHFIKLISDKTAANMNINLPFLTPTLLLHYEDIIIKYFITPTIQHKNFIELSIMNNVSKVIKITKISYCSKKRIQYPTSYRITIIKYNQ